MLRELVQKLPTLSRSTKRAILVSYDLLAMAAALWGAFSARLGALFDPSSLSVWLAAPASFLVSLFAFYRLGIYHIVLRYFDLRAVTRMFAAAAFAAATWVASA
jgi:FlaA1/EpsC-like NDP-sugar epimerase